MRQISRVCLGILLALPTLLWGQTAPIPYHLQTYPLNSGVHSGSGDETIAPALAYNEIIQVAGVPWLRLRFSETFLGTRSYLLLRSLRDGAEQRLDATSTFSGKIRALFSTVMQWSCSSMSHHWTTTFFSEWKRSRSVSGLQAKFRKASVVHWTIGSPQAIRRPADCWTSDVQPGSFVMEGWFRPGTARGHHRCSIWWNSTFPLIAQWNDCPSWTRGSVCREHGNSRFCGWGNW